MRRFREKLIIQPHCITNSKKKLSNNNKNIPILKYSYRR